MELPRWKTRFLVSVTCIVASTLALPSLASRAVAAAATPSASELFGNKVSMLGRSQYPDVYSGAAIGGSGSLVI